MPVFCPLQARYILVKYWLAKNHMQSTNVQSTTGNLPVGKRHYGQRTSWQRPIGLNTTGKWMLGKMLRGQYDWQANYDRPQKIFPLLYLRYSGIGSGRKKSFIIHSFAHSPVILVFEWDNYVPNYPNYLTCHKKMVTFFPLCNRNEWNCRGWSFYCTCYSANFVGLFCDRNCPFFLTSHVGLLFPLSLNHVKNQA